MEDSNHRGPGRSAALVLIVEREGAVRDLETLLGCDVTAVSDRKAAAETQVA
jgi:hypothetical protein